MNLEEKIKNLTPYELIDAMIIGLKNPSCQINMITYGNVIDGICFGCAATNAIQYLSGEKFTPDNIIGGYNRAKYLKLDLNILDRFENAINYLRLGNIDTANFYLAGLGIPKIIYDLNKRYPELTTENYMENLHHYEELRDQQKH